MKSNPSDSLKPQPAEKKNRLRKNLLVVVMFALVLAVTITLFIFRNQILKLGDYGYLGTFFLSLATNATIILPMPSILMILPLGATFNPLYIGLAAGLGGAIGEMTAYVAGYTGRGLWRDNPTYIKTAGWLKRWGMLIVFVFSVTPMPLDIMGIAAGNLRLPAWKFFVPAWLGKTIKYIVLAYAGYWGWEALISDEKMRMTLIVAVTAALSVGILLVLALLLEHFTWKNQRTKL